MKIKDVEKQVGISKANIRFYEEEGLIHPARNQENNYREYSKADVEQLQEIKKLRLIGIPVQEIKESFIPQTGRDRKRRTYIKGNETDLPESIEK